LGAKVLSSFLPVGFYFTPFIEQLIDKNSVIYGR